MDTRKDGVFPDLVFSLAAPGSTARDVHDKGACVGVGIMSYRGWRHDGKAASPVYLAYLAKMKRFVLWLRQRGYRVRLLGGDERDTAAHQDFLAMLRVDEGGHLGDWLTAEPTVTLNQILDQIAATDLVVATRFHNVLCALMMARPVISIGYARKNDVLMQDMGAGAYCQQIEQLDVDRLIVQFEALVASKDDLIQGLRRKSESHREALRQQERLLASRVL